MIEEEYTLDMNNIEKEDAYISMDWLTIKNYEFKILVMITCLAEYDRAYRGTLSKMCNFFGVQKSGTTYEKIRQAIYSLAEKGDLTFIADGENWILSLSTKAEKKPKIIRIKKAYIYTIKQYKAVNKNDSVAWDNILKVFVYLYSGDDQEIRTYRQIAKALDVSETVVKNAVKALTTIEFNDDLVVRKKVARVKCIETNQYITIGTKYDILYDWDKSN